MGTGGVGIGKNENGDSRVESSTHPSLRRLKPPAISLRGVGLKQYTRQSSGCKRQGRKGLEFLEINWNEWRRVNEGTRGLRLEFWGIRCLERKGEG
jgi:hypothetical protein